MSILSTWLDRYLPIPQVFKPDPPAPVDPAAKPMPRERDPRLDFFRGLAMLIIMIAHTPGNLWTRWIPARWGPSDATEMFVFCSGIAAAIAFGGTFARAGFWTGTRRILFRCWQIYWAHIGIFVAICFAMASANEILGPGHKDYISSLALNPFFQRTEAALIGFMTLTWVPNYFDILPMYFAILLFTPLIIALKSLDLRLAILAMVATYVIARVMEINLPASPWSERGWFFNPLCWQLLFFTGFIFGRGWLKPPPFVWWLLALAIGYVLVMMCFSNVAMRYFEEVRPFGRWVFERGHKTNFHLTRYLHILALAYIALWIFHTRKHWLLMAWAKPIVVTGQQALATFMASMVMGRLAGIALDLLGRENWSFLVVNLTSLSLVIAVAYMVRWYKRMPWRAKQGGPAQAPAANPASG